jgi:cytochrome d ubiquinol oxidase subunit I
MGLIGTRSLNTEMPGIDELVKRAKVRIREGIKAYDALQKIRAAGGTAANSRRACAASFEDNGRQLGYALLLRRYVDDPRTATDEQIDQGRVGHRAAGGAAVLDCSASWWARRLLHRDDGDLLHARLGAPPAREATAGCWVAVFAIPLPWVAIESRLVGRGVRPPALGDRRRAAHRGAAVSHLGI